MSRQLIARLLLVAAVLLAQHTAIAHELWHASGAQAAQDGKGLAAKKLCHLHDLLGTVLGVVSAAKLPLALLAFSAVRFFPVADGAAAARPLPPQSRGPPRIS